MRQYKISFKNGELLLGPRVLVMGILNVTPDSFSDGGRFFDTEKAVKRGISMVENGADIIDIGGESTRPFSDPVPEDLELARVIPVIEQLAAKISKPVSIDTQKAVVAEKALKAGASIVNDVSAFNSDPKMAEVVAESKAPVILMHMAGTPRTMQENPSYEDVIEEVSLHLEKSINKALEAGIDKSKIIVDPGIGFGKTLEHNLMLIKNLDLISRRLDAPILLGHSRKSFLRKILEEDLKRQPTETEMERATQAVSVLGAFLGAHILRVHEVEQTMAGLAGAMRLRDV